MIYTSKEMGDRSHYINGDLLDSKEEMNQILLDIEKTLF